MLGYVGDSRECQTVTHQWRVPRARGDARRVANNRAPPWHPAKRTSSPATHFFRTFRTESVADLRVHMSGQHDPISGKYTFDLPNRSDDDYSDNYAFDEERANREYDYVAERKERKDMMDESDNEEGGTPSEQQDVRFKYLPENFKVSSNLDFLQPGVAKNLTLDPRHYIHTLRRIQQYMIPLVLNEFTFVVVGPQGLGKTTGYMLPLVNKLVELREIENRGRRGPLAIVVTYTENKIRHIRELCNRYSHGTSLNKCYPTKEDLQSSLGSSNAVFDFVCASASTLVDTIYKLQMPLNRLKFLIIEEFHFCTKESEFMRQLNVIKEILRKRESQPTIVFVAVSTSEEKMFDVRFMLEFANTKVARLVAPPMMEDISVAVLPCLSIKDHCYWLLRLVTSHPVTVRKAVIMVDHPRRAHFLSLLLTHYGVSTIYLTRGDSLLDVEEAVRRWRNEEYRVIVADYDSIKDLDYGFVETCILFELPGADFCGFTKRFLSLSAKSIHKRRIYVLLNKELDSAAASCVLQFLESLRQAVPHFLAKLAEESGDPDDDESSDESS